MNFDCPRLIQTGTVSVCDGGRAVTIRHDGHKGLFHKRAFGSMMTWMTFCIARQREGCSGTTVITEKMLLKTLPTNSRDAHHPGHSATRRCQGDVFSGRRSSCRVRAEASGDVLDAGVEHPSVPPRGKASVQLTSSFP